MEIEVDSNLIYEATLGKRPGDADVAIVPIDNVGTEGSLNGYVLREYNYDVSVLKKLDLSKGFSLLQSKGKKSILFIVTISEGSTEENLEKNLRAGILRNLYFISAKKVWLPLMGTGEGQLHIQRSFEITKQVLESLSTNLFQSSAFFWVSFPQSALKEFNDIKGYNPRVSIVDDLGLDIDKFLGSFEGDFYLAGASWGEIDKTKEFFERGVWEDGDEDRGSGLIKDVNAGDIIFLKSSFHANGISYLRIKGVGVVSHNPRTGGRLKVSWEIQYEKYIDIEHLGKYRRTFVRVMPDDELTIIKAIGIEDIANLLLESAAFSKNNSSSTHSETNTISIAGFLNDSDDGVDYLNIKKDVQAFARVVAAKSFRPPLAIALFGKWGSGKSFFMRKLKNEINNISFQTQFDAFCEGVVHIHFNAWSYVDANLWASIVTRIFEGLKDYITDNTASEEIKKKVEEKLTKELTITKEEIYFLTSQKESVEEQIKNLTSQKETLKEDLDGKISEIKSKSLANVINEVDKNFDAKTKIEAAFKNNSTYSNSREQLENVVPKEYWDNPEKAYQEAKSGYAFLREFFRSDKLAKNLLFIIGLLLILLFVPDILALFSDQIAKANFTFPQTIISVIIVSGGILRRIKAVHKELEPLVTGLWKIKENYHKEVNIAVSQYEQDEKRLKLEISAKEVELQIVDKHIQQATNLKTDIEFKISNALATEALYGFIEKRCNTEDYKKYLGIVSTIRKDFEILSDLFSGHQMELKSLGLKKPIERIVLYIDDLDRCPEENVVQVLEAVNLLMAYPLFVVVVGVDPRWIKNALLKKHYTQFGADGQINVINPSDYLEKIFQVSFYLKDSDDTSVRGMLKKLAETKPGISLKPEYDAEAIVDTNGIVERLVTDDAIKQPINREIYVPTNHREQDILEALEITENEIALMQTISWVIGNNPRSIKRFVNTYKIAKAHEDFPLKEEDNNENILAIMFLLAFPIGPFKKLMSPFVERIRKGGTGSLSEFSKTISDENQKNSFYGNLLLHENWILKDISIQVYKKYLDFVERFTFREV